MKHNNRIFRLLLAALLLTTGGAMHHLSAQTTEGTDFWVTLMRGDERNYDTLSLRFSAKEATKVYIENAYTGYRDTVEVGNNDIRSLKLNNQDYSCYVTDLEGEQVSEKALHVTADKNISMIAANYKDKSFDVASILPTAALMSEYRIQSYPPYAHKNNSQGSHFVIIAAEDNTVVDITPTANTDKGHMAGQTFATDTLMRGQTYYVWTGYGSGDYYDFTGTVIKARGGKKIAVFNGNPHTNIPSIEDRDHVYSQAMPVNYWGKRFAITSSLTTIDNQKDKDNKDYKKLDGFWERIDKIRVQALIDGTVVYVDGDSVYTFDFATNPKHVYEFDFGARDKMTKDGTSFSSYRYFEGASHYVETSCPSAVHLFMTSNRFDHTTRKIDGTDYKYCNGDPSEIWVNPIEQQIKSLTFCTFQTKQVTDHFLNIVTATTSVSSMLLDGKDISAQFQPLNGNAAYSYARITALADGTHTLVSDSGFIAHVYGFGQRESYGYPAGGNTKDLTASVEIDGEIYTPGTKKQICPKGDDNTINLSCKLNYEYESMTWEFGDGSPQQKGKIEEVDHLYPSPGVYEAWVAIQRSLTDWCEGMEQPVDTINFIVNIGNYKIDVDSTYMPGCIMPGTPVDYLIYLNNPAGLSLNGDSVKLGFNKVALNDGFNPANGIQITDSLLTIRVPSSARHNVTYGVTLHIGSVCPNSVLDKTLDFTVKYDIPLLQQRFDNVLGLLTDSFPGKVLTDYVWYKDGIPMQDEHSSVLTIEDGESNSGEYYVCYKVHKDESDTEGTLECTCPIAFTANSDKPAFESDNGDITVQKVGRNLYVNADAEGTAEWIRMDGTVLSSIKLPVGGTLVEVPDQAGLYVLRVVTGEGKQFKQRNFKFLIEK